MLTFDEVLPALQVLLRDELTAVGTGRIVANRDLNGRVRLIVEKRCVESPSAREALERIAKRMAKELAPHSYPEPTCILAEESLDAVLADQTWFPLDGADSVLVIDRLATEGNWASVNKATEKVPRIVFYSLKGGVGRSTALTAASWGLAEAGRRVLVVDLDLESPGLSSSLLPTDQRPKFGVVDWLVEDLVGGADSVIRHLHASSSLSHNGDILVVPAHGHDPGEYISKLGRSWMPKLREGGQREPWSMRLERMLTQLEDVHRPDVILIDSRAGIDEIASACVTDLSASSILLFATDSDQTWVGYRMLFNHWRRCGVVRSIRERLQLVGAMVPETDRANYLDGLIESAWNLFSEELYDEVPPDQLPGDEQIWSFDQSDPSAPHFPWPVLWNRGFASIQSLHTRFEGIALDETRAVFGSLNDGVSALVSNAQAPQ
jgi:hypothetical protein